nr:hypothetical protein [Tanacetum cinerariifolium]
MRLSFDEAVKKILARQLVRLTQQTTNLQSSRAQMRGIATHTKEAVGLRMRINGWVICFVECHFAVHMDGSYGWTKGKSQLLRFASLKKMKMICDMINRMAHNSTVNLIPGDRNIIREGKVYRRWISQNPPNSAATRYYCIVLYREGKAVNANMPTILNISSRCLSMIIKQKKVVCPHSGSIIELTLWDKMARNFDKDALELLEKPVIMVVSFCGVSKYRNVQLQLSTTSVTHCYLNPHIQEAKESRAEERHTP